MGANIASRKAFLQAILHKADNLTERLIFADWLDEHGEDLLASVLRLQGECERKGLQLDYQIWMAIRTNLFRPYPCRAPKTARTQLEQLQDILVSVIECDKAPAGQPVPLFITAVSASPPGLDSPTPPEG